MRTLAERLDRLLRDKKLSRRAIAREAAVTPAAVTKWLRGTKPRKQTLIVLCARLHISYRWLTEGVGEQDAPGIEMEVHSLPALAEYLRATRPPQIELGELRSQYSALSAEHSRMAAIYQHKVDSIDAELADKVTAAQRKLISANQVGKKDLENTYGSVFLPLVNSAATINDLLIQLKSAARAMGGQRRLAAALKVSPQQLNDWLSGRVSPSGKATLRLFNWIGKREDTKTKVPGARERPRDHRRSKQKESNDEPTSDQQKSSPIGKKKSTQKRPSVKH